MSGHNLNLYGVLSETNRVIRANRRHFYSLAVLFVLPLSFSVVVYPSLSQATSIFPSPNRFLSSFYATENKGENPPYDKSGARFTVLYYLFVLLFSLFTAASITHSTCNGFYGGPLKLTSSLRSILVSFLPLTATYLVAQLIVGLIISAVGGLTGLMYAVLLFFGVGSNYDSVYFLGFVVLVTVLFVGVIIYIQLEWYLAHVVVVVESKWGFEPLRRSSYLVKGMKKVAFSMSICFGLLLGLISAFFSSLVPSAVVSGSDRWMFVLQTVCFTGLATILMLYSVTAHAVFFMYCKALRGELALDVVDEFAPLYLGLPIYGDEKAPKVVYAV